MSAAAHAVPPQFRVATRGYTQVPNSLVENLAVLSHAELALALIVMRRGEAVLSDKNWVKWTGLKPRMKQYAVAGLKNRKILRVEGVGDDARFAFERRDWDVFVRNVPVQIQRPNTLGRRKGVLVKSGAMVHPDCRERGCLRLSEENANLSLVPCSAVQPVAQTCNPIPKLEVVKNKSDSVAPAQPVAQIETVWSATLEEIRRYFPIVGDTFVLRLLAIIRARFLRVTDAELAAAVKAAWVAKKRKQTTEGLFLLTVPDALASLRRESAVPVAPVVKRDIASSLGAVAQKLEAKGGDWVSFGFMVRQGIEQIERGQYDSGDLLLGEAEAQAGIYALSQLKGLDLESCELRVKDWSQQYKNVPAKTLQLLRGRAALEFLGIPRFGDF